MIELHAVTKERGGRAVLNSVDLVLPGKGLVCVVGPSGCGKTTLVNIVAGLDRDYSGTVRVGGTDLASLSARDLDRWRAREVGFVFQDFHLLAGADALENVLVASRLHEDDAARAKARAQEALESLGLGGVMGRAVETLSGGEQQRVAIARALVWNPSVLIADEPTGSLDAASACTVMGELERVARERLVLMVTHDRSLLRHADVVVKIEQGAALVEATVAPVGPGAAVAERGAAAVGQGAAVAERGAAADAVSAPGHCASTPRFSSAQSPATRSGAWAGPAGALSSIKRRARQLCPLALLFSLCGALICAALAVGGAVDRAIARYEQQNVGFFCGFVGDGANEELHERLLEDPRVAAVWRQKTFGPIEVEAEGTTVVLEEKVPLPRATEQLSFGALPARGKNEIALSPSLARKLTSDLSSLVGVHARVTSGGATYEVTISGIYNAGYDDVFLSSDIEDELCLRASAGEFRALSFEVADLASLPELHEELAADGIDVTDASDMVAAALASFSRLRATFRVVSLVVAVISLVAGTLLFARIQLGRTEEFGLRRALGFTRAEVRSLCRREVLPVAAFAGLAAAVLMAVLAVVPLPGGALVPLPVHVLAGVIVPVVALVLASEVLTIVSLRTDPATALAAD